MILWRVEYNALDGDHRGFNWFVRCRDARAEVKRWRNVEGGEASAEKIKVPINRGRDAAAKFLNRYASHADNG